MSWGFHYNIEVKCYDCMRTADGFVIREPHVEGVVGCKKCGLSMKVHYPVWKTIHKQEGQLRVRITPLP